MNREITEKLSIRPYLGVGYQSAIVTTSKSNSLVNELEVVGIETRYQSKLISSVSVPMGVDFHFHKKNLGITTGIYLNASNYTEIGIRIGLTFGKL